MSAALDGWRRALALCGLVVALDQVTKAIAIDSLVQAERVEIGLGFEVANVRNKGVAFGLFDGSQSLVIAITIVAMCFVVAYFARHAATPGLWIPVGLLSGGALGNLADRVRIDSVIDFVDPPLWPAFNLADLAITAGVISLLLAYERAHRASAPGRSDDD